MPICNLGMARFVERLPAVLRDTTAPALPPVKLIDAVPIRAALDKMNAKNWRMVKKYLLATLTPAVVTS